MSRFRTSSCAFWILAAALVADPAAAASGLEIFPHAKPLIALIALYAVLIWPANVVLWQPLLRALDQRGDRIAGTRARAEKIASQAEDVLASYQSATERARVAAESERMRTLESARGEQAQITTDARHAAEAEVVAARDAVAAAYTRARADLQGSARELGREAAARVLGRPLS